MKPKSTAFGEISTRTSHGSWSFSRAATRRSSWRSIRRWFIRLTSPNQSQSKSTVSVSLRSASVSAARPCASASATQFSEHSEISCTCFFERVHKHLLFHFMRLLFNNTRAQHVELLHVCSICEVFSNVNSLCEIFSQNIYL